MSAHLPKPGTDLTNSLRPHALTSMPERQGEGFNYRCFGAKGEQVDQTSGAERTSPASSPGSSTRAFPPPSSASPLQPSTARQPHSFLPRRTSADPNVKNSRTGLEATPSLPTAASASPTPDSPSRFRQKTLPRAPGSTTASASPASSLNSTPITLGPSPPVLNQRRSPPTHPRDSARNPARLATKSTAMDATMTSDPAWSETRALLEAAFTRPNIGSLFPRSVVAWGTAEERRVTAPTRIPVFKAGRGVGVVVDADGDVVMGGDGGDIGGSGSGVGRVKRVAVAGGLAGVRDYMRQSKVSSCTTAPTKRRAPTESGSFAPVFKHPTARPPGPYYQNLAARKFTPPAPPPPPTKTPSPNAERARLAINERTVHRRPAWAVRSSTRDASPESAALARAFVNGDVEGLSSDPDPALLASHRYSLMPLDVPDNRRHSSWIGLPVIFFLVPVPAWLPPSRMTRAGAATGGAMGKSGGIDFAHLNAAKKYHSFLIACWLASFANCRLSSAWEFTCPEAPMGIFSYFLLAPLSASSKASSVLR
ncbi:hypothetical protein BDK51DRAFT_46946 [Blyttiomyces helicus]|uniref:Uncharacterized protein n=1 Tax=Blyttiomyces helicus TaxID=388810 RepID=A0A4P9W571_9FUNG|nr:hypothetical protein BDK51DRAFT_46946 [Blyttiomyces helicus]|eukprot:RKO86435.1 hypothetical protein BDK51DRAFT_46946 [Blyttiomyces helicus]